MKLKTLELSGFKSFPDKSNIFFPSGISAVVGPNGCGKSNIVDALRWAMGEMRVKQLRGKAMEDVIFSGANGNPPLNMAEVSLTLKNDDGRAPRPLNDFSEIMITRRLFRSGESAYFINKQPCRLKDILDLFAHGGMGTKTYAIIHQGNVGAITEAGPDERRIFIEEAAGITRYKIQKKEALRKIDATHQNLLRLEDIITEIDRQMEILKSQAEKAEQYLMIQNRIRILDTCLGLHHYDLFTARMMQIGEKLSQYKDDDASHLAQLKRKEADIEIDRLLGTEKNHYISQCKTKIFETQRNIDKIENDVTHLKTDKEKLKNEIHTFGAALLKEKEKSGETTAEISRLEKQQRSRQAEIAILKTALAKLENGSRTVQNEYEQLNRLIEAKKTDQVVLAGKASQHGNIIQTALKNTASLTRQLKQADEEKLMADRDVIQLTQTQRNAQKDIQHLEEKLEKLHTYIETLGKEHRKKEKELKEQDNLIQRITSDLNQVQSHYGVLKKMADNYEWYESGVKALLNRKTEKQGTSADTVSGDPFSSDSSGIIGLVADILEPHRSYAPAVEAALGESLQYLLVKDRESALTAIQYLQDKNSGRCGFLPMTSVKNDATQEGNDKPCLSTCILDHISVRPGFENIGKLLLANVGFTAEIKDALDRAESFADKQSIVTSSGDMVLANGIIIGGSKVETAGILSKRQEMKQLKQTVQVNKQKLASAQRSHSQLFAAADVIQSEYTQCKARSQDLAKAKIDGEKALYRANQDLKHAARKLEVLGLEQERLHGEINETTAEQAANEKRYAEINLKIENTQADLDEAVRKQQMIFAQKETASQAIVSCKLKLTDLNARMEDGETTLRRLNDYQKETLNRERQLADGISEKQKAEAQSKQKIAGCERKLESLYDNLSHFENELASFENDFHLVEARLEKTKMALSAISEHREKNLRKIDSLENQKSQLHAKREALSVQLQERYHKPLAQLAEEASKKPDWLISLIHENPTDASDIEKVKNELEKNKKRISTMDNINPGAINEYEVLKKRHDFMRKQRDDLIAAISDLKKVIKKINGITQKRFLKTFDEVNQKLGEIFPRLFEGGSAKLYLTQPQAPLETGVAFSIHPPKKKITRMSLLSGGEKALAAIAFIFSILLIKPTSFCIMDEIDAPLDDANVLRFNRLLKFIGETTQIIMITHNKKSMEFADTLFGVTMGEKGVSKLVSVNFDSFSLNNQA
jgi:chromosome segregation protein